MIVMSFLAGQIAQEQLHDKTRPCGQAVKTAPSHGAIPGSIPGKVTKLELSEHHYYRTVGSGSFFIAVKGITWWMKEAECFNRSASILLFDCVNLPTILFGHKCHNRIASMY